ncbi:MAG: rod shape-determining protein MreC [Salinivirgaceae bacterium]|nr:rod shape-determining protein MreC [Salinivirgaceae bacterium]
MKSLLKFIYKYHYFIIFILIECFSIFLTIQYNDYQKTAYLNSSNNLSGAVYSKMNGISQYLNLKEKNQELIYSLASYKELSKKAYKKNQISLIEVYDSVYIQQFEFIPCQVINNSVNKQNNYLTLNAGFKQGVIREMAVVSPMGIVGIVKDATDNYASVISVLNQNLRISAMLKRTGYFGSLNWDGLDYRYVNLLDLPNHISVNKGDTVITSGYSSMFPKGELIGFVEGIEDSDGSEFIKVRVKLSVNFKNISNVMVVSNLLRNEQLTLENKSSHD